MDAEKRKSSRMKIIKITALIALFATQIKAQNIVISEVLPNNISQIVDVDGHRHDWIELYNPSDSVVNLSGYSISSKSGAWNFPDWELGAGQYSIIMASGKKTKHTY